MENTKELVAPLRVSGRVASKVMMDITVYLVGPSVKELEFLLELYKEICPEKRYKNYTTTELDFWPKISNPILTSSCRKAALNGIKEPIFESTRKRIREGRAFSIGIWDGMEIDDINGSWSFACQSFHLRSTGLHSFVRILMPLNVDPKIVECISSAIANNVELYSGHGGLVFVYNTLMTNTAFNHIYKKSRRFWGVDIEDLSSTVPLMKENIKGIGWITILGNSFLKESIKIELGRYSKCSNIELKPNLFGSIIICGNEPVYGDQNRPDNSLEPYNICARVLHQLFVNTHPDFPSEQFIQNSNTLGWINRFIEPQGWR